MHMRIQAHESNPSKSNYKLRCISVYIRGCTVANRHGIATFFRGQEMMPMTWILLYWYLWGANILDVVCLLRQEILYSWDKKFERVGLSHKHFNSTCLPHFPYDRSLSTVATTYIWHSSNVRSGKHVNQNIVPSQNHSFHHSPPSYLVIINNIVTEQPKYFRALASYSVP
jgi:hypothetical protein